MGTWGFQPIATAAECFVLPGFREGSKDAVSVNRSADFDPAASRITAESCPESIQTMQTSIRDTGDAVFYSLTGALQRFFGFLPALLGAFIILVVGWFVAGLVARLIERGLGVVGFERAVEHSGVGEFIRRSGTKRTTSGVVALLIKAFIFLIFVQAAANVLGIPQLTEVLNRIVLYIPNLIVAMAIIVLGALVAKVLAGVVRGSVSELGVGNPALLGTATEYVVIGFAVIAALDQLDIAPTLVTTLLIGLVGSVALAVGLAFGLGGRDVAREITQRWYLGSQDLADAARQRAESDPDRPKTRPARSTTQVFRAEP